VASPRSRDRRSRLHINFIPEICVNRLKNSSRNQGFSQIRIRINLSCWIQIPDVKRVFFCKKCPFWLFFAWKWELLFFTLYSDRRRFNTFVLGIKVISEREKNYFKKLHKKLL
jgi:hypothetical protein